MNHPRSTQHQPNRHSNDSVARLTGTWLLNSSGTTLDYAGNICNLGNQRTKQTRADASYYEFTCDGNLQLKTAVGGVAAEKRGYFYEPTWNPNWRTVASGCLTA